jgi:hypothetical protein
MIVVNKEEKKLADEYATDERNMAPKVQMNINGEKKTFYI